MAYPIANLGDLTSALGDWAWRSTDPNFTAAIPQMIANFEARVKRKRRTLEMQKEITGTLTGGIGGAQVTIPADYLEMIAFELTGMVNPPTQPLTYVTPDRARQIDATTQTTGTAVNYTIMNGIFLVVPQVWVAANTTYVLDYYGFTGLASAPGGVNWLLTKHPDIYMAGALLQGAAYIDDKELVAQWKTAVDEFLEELGEADKKARFGQGPLVMRPSVSFRTQRRPVLPQA